MLAGFAAATYLRHCARSCAEALLAQVDSAIGGKVGVNRIRSEEHDRLVLLSRAVVIDPTVLGTLPRREFRAGLYEVIKYGVTSSAGLFDRISRDRSAIFAREPAALTPVIAESCGIKAAVVSADEREAGPRRILNFGHTAGHAIEAVTKYKRYRHGEAVAYGMLVAAELAQARGALAERDKKALADPLLVSVPCPRLRTSHSADSRSDASHDKKVVSDRLHVVLPTSIGPRRSSTMHWIRRDEGGVEAGRL
jgi:3-dehydroquinate synthase